LRPRTGVRRTVQGDSARGAGRLRSVTEVPCDGSPLWFIRLNHRSQFIRLNHRAQFIRLNHRVQFIRLNHRRSSGPADRTADAGVLSSLDRGPMRLTVLLALLACGSPDRCLPCDGALTVGVEYLCDGSVCGPGESVGSPYLQCSCRTAGDVMHFMTIPVPSGTTACSSARSQWAAFAAANCH